MTRSFTITWHLRQRMAEHGIFKTTELVPLLAERGVMLSREQVYRMVTSTPARLNVDVLAALCDILNCTPNDLLEVTAVAARTVNEAAAPVGIAPIGNLRPVPARISRPQQ